MAGLNVSARNAMVDGLAAVTTHIALFDATGTELTGGAPAYARKAVTWTAAAAGIRDNNAQLLFDVPAVTVAFHGLMSAITAGTTHAILPVQGGSPALPMAWTFLASTDVFTTYAHGFSNDQRVVLNDVATAGLPTGYDETTVYWVVAVATDTFQLSATQGGAAVNGTTNGEGFVQRCVPEIFAAQGQYSIATGALDLDANLI